MWLTDEELYLDYCKEMGYPPAEGEMRDTLVSMVTIIREAEPRLNSGVHLCDYYVQSNDEGKMPDDYFNEGRKKPLSLMSPKERAERRKKRRKE